MKRPIGKIILLLAMVLLPLCCWGQKRLYTKSYRLQDFKSKTTKIVLDGTPEFNATLRQDITSLWTITPYEFCTPAQYEKQKNNPDICFLHTEINRGIVFLTLAKGGRPDDTNTLKRPMEIISIPIAGERDDSGLELLYMPAFISIIQDYTEAAMNSEVVAYSGLKAITDGVPRRVKVYSNPEEAKAAFTSQLTASAVQIIISPDGSLKSKPRHKLIFSTEDYRLYHYNKVGM